MNFRSVFIAIVAATALIVSAFLVNSQRPRLVVDQPSAAFVRASGKCAECHLNAQYSVVHEFEMSVHAAKGVTCLDCHQIAPGQTRRDHNGFVVNTKVTPANCRSCHEAVYQQFVRSRHAAPSWASVAGDKDFTAEQIAFAEQHHPGGVKRPPNALAMLKAFPRRRADASVATASDNRTTTARLETVRRATLGMRRRSSTRACRARAANATWVLTIRRWKSTPSRSTARCSPRNDRCSISPRRRAS